MAYDLSKYLVIGISSRALFDLFEENEIYEREGLEEYSRYQHEHEEKILKPGAGFALVKAILHLNELVPNKRKSEVIIMSRNGADTSLRIFNSIEHYEMDISRAALTGGTSLAPYLSAFDVDLFLSASEDDVQAAIDANIAAGLIYNFPNNYEGNIDQIRIAFDGDAVLFSEESEKIYQEKGLKAFLEHEKKNARNPLPDGPFAKLLRTLSFLQFEAELDTPPIRIALVTARNTPAHERVIRTLRAWKVRVDESFFLGGVEKSKVLKAFGAHIFFDDQDAHCGPASEHVPVARVPYRSGTNKTLSVDKKILKKVKPKRDSIS
ncbi:MAG: 5'-nucleotidase [Candidatus Bathyarchaeota archaeon]|nr:5'-nucleotidase [Candidatus Bathyarchaeota archaeon]